MKNLLIALALMSSFQLSAQDFNTADNLDYIVVFKDDANFKRCYSQVKKIAKNDGNSKVKIIALEMGIVGVNLTTFGADQVGQLKCVFAVELDGEVEANPRLGRNN